MIGPNGKELPQRGVTGRLKGFVRKATGKLHEIVDRRTDFDETTKVTLHPDGVSRPEQWVLVSYLVEPFLLEPGTPVPNSHTNQWESLQMARTFLELGYGVDVISYRNTSFVPKRDYRLFIGARTNFARLAELLPEDCLKVAHLDTAHWLVNNSNAYARAVDIKYRRRVAVDLPRKVVEPNWAIESADCATILGNDFTADSYSYAGKPIYRLPLPSCQTFDWPEEKDFERSRKRFIWFGSDGLVHKGLDLALEAFAGMPDFELTVCGPISQDARFVEAYHRELYELDNIRTADWVDIDSDEFREITSRSLGVVYPSCSEGGGGSVITCMQAGLVPLVTRESSVDIDSRFGVLLEDASIEGIRMAARALSERPPDELRAMSKAAWRTARHRYTRERYAQAFRHVMEQVLERRSERRAHEAVVERVPQVAG